MYNKLLCNAYQVVLCKLILLKISFGGPSHRNGNKYLVKTMQVIAKFKLFNPGIVFSNIA